MTHPQDPDSTSGGKPFSQDVHHAAVSARVPENVRRGVFGSAVMVLQCGDDFVLDFLSTIVPPQQVVARVVLTAGTFSKFVSALQFNVNEYQRVFGPLRAQEPIMSGTIGPEGQTIPNPPPAPRPATPETAAAGSAPAAGPGPAPAAGPAAPSQPPHPPVSTAEPTDIGDVYGQLKLPDELLGGVYATGAMIRHTPQEFAIDFLTNFYPRAVVTARIFLAAGRMLSFVETFQNAWNRYTQGPPPGSRQPPAHPGPG